MVVWPSITFLLVLRLASAQMDLCEPSCSSPCASITEGNMLVDCAGCGPDMACHPRAPDYHGERNTTDAIHNDSVRAIAQHCESLKEGLGARGRFGQSTRLYRHDGTDGPSSAWRGPPLRDCFNPSTKPKRPDCRDVESVERLDERGWVVLRQLMPPMEAAALATITRVDAACSAFHTNTASPDECPLSGVGMRQKLPVFVRHATELLGRWEADGLAEAAGLGRGLSLGEGNVAARRVHLSWDHDMEGESWVEEMPRRYYADWHAGAGGSREAPGSHRLWIMLSKEGDEGGGDSSDARELPDLCMLSTREVDACDTPELRIRASSTFAVHDLYDSLGCCISLEVGDGIFYREDVLHRPEIRDGPAPMAMIAAVEVQTEDEPRRLPTTEEKDDVRCGDWAANGNWCSEQPGFMACVCTRACASCAAAVEEEENAAVNADDDSGAHSQS